jgi:GGDEF domain-containing protein
MRANKRLFVFLATLGFWLIISVFGSFLLIQADTQILALALFAFTVTIALTNLFRFAGWLAAILSIVIYSLASIGLRGLYADILMPIGYFSIGILVTTALAYVITREVNTLNIKLDNDQKLIDELRIYDPVTGLMRYQQALHLLKSEIIRSQRNNKDICLFLVQIELRDKETDVESANRQLVGSLMNSVRAIDIPFGGEKYGAVLPETNLAGAKIVVDRLINTMVNKVRVPISIGIAQFPVDGVSDDEMARAAEAALHVASTTGKPFVQYSQIRDAAEINSKV